MRAIDFHVHLPTPDWLDGSMAGYVEAAEALLADPVELEDVAVEAAAGVEEAPPKPAAKAKAKTKARK